MRIFRFILCLSLTFHSAAYADRIKDLTDVAGVRANQLLGFGLVVGLAGSGDGKDLLILLRRSEPPCLGWALVLMAR
jgi:flagellar P-ring protein precursor FlgI